MVSPTGSISGILHVLVSKCYCNKLLQTSWLTPGIYYLTDLEVRSPKWVLGDQGQGVSRLITMSLIPFGSSRGKPFSSLYRLPLAPWPVAPPPSPESAAPCFQVSPASGLCSRPHLSLSDLNFSSLFWLLRSLVWIHGVHQDNLPISRLLT